MCSIQDLDSLYNAYKVKTQIHAKLKSVFQLTPEQITLNKFKYAARKSSKDILCSESCCSNIWVGSLFTWMSRDEVENKYEVLDIQMKEDGCVLRWAHILACRQNIYYLLDQSNNSRGLVPHDKFLQEFKHIKYALDNPQLAIQNFRNSFAAKKIQRCVRDWLWKPYYRSGHVGYHARKGFEHVNAIDKCE
jgi:hypothetical protein